MAVVTEPSGHVLIPVPHVQQHFSWDCGLACSKMVLKYLQINFADFESVCTNLGFHSSVWTVDLAHIMAHYKVPHLFATLTYGVDKGYSKQKFYKTNFTEDEGRVNSLFDSPETLGISICKRSVPINEVKRHLDAGNVIIFLVDWNHLDCRRCHRRIKAFPCITQCLSSFQGHYVVVVGYDNAEKAIYYKNPSYKDDLCCCSLKTFNMARKSYGTDEDVLFIYGAAAPSDNPVNSLGDIES